VAEQLKEAIEENPPTRLKKKTETIRKAEAKPDHSGRLRNNYSRLCGLLFVMCHFGNQRLQPASNPFKTV